MHNPEESTTPSAEAASTPPLGGEFKNNPERLHNLPRLKTFRTELRRNLTPAEATLWKALQKSRIEGRKFRRQHSIGNYILDFFCVSERLGIELDGAVHFNDLAQQYDHERKLFLNHFGVKIIRFENFLVFQEMEYVIHRITSNFEWWKEKE
ncbi:MAG: DUF559 domain-containing protein [Pyrinomonadaceae bacterium]